MASRPFGILLIFLGLAVVLTLILNLLRRFF
jgi:hypothetical protein